MDSNAEEKIYHQIEKNLSNNIDDSIFTTGQIYEDRNLPERGNSLFGHPVTSYEPKSIRQDTVKLEPVRQGALRVEQARQEQARPDEVLPEQLRQEQDREDNRTSAGFPSLSRDEYIRQARESCLRQMSALQAQSRSMMDYSYATEIQNTNIPSKRKANPIKIPKNGIQENTAKEVASFRSLIIRTICAVVIFLSIFIIDKLKIEWKNFTYETVREFITENDTLAELETKIVSWLD